MIHEELANNFTEVYFHTCANSGYQVVFCCFFLMSGLGSRLVPHALSLPKNKLKKEIRH